MDNGKRVERPILFNGEMVRAILEGRKTQTRRVVNPRPDARPQADYVDGVWYEQDQYGDPYPIRCPYGEVGDLLWVRETFIAVGGMESPNVRVVYKASGDPEGIWTSGIAWKPSIHMPKKFARLWLEVTGVRVARVQDITEEDAEKEGVVRDETRRHWYSIPQTSKEAFRRVWDGIYGKNGNGWERNPWVWVVEFERVERVAQ
jgi:hypothetical protein